MLCFLMCNVPEIKNKKKVRVMNIVDNAEEVYHAALQLFAI